MAATGCSQISNLEGNAQNFRPKNVLLIMTDQQHAGALSCMGHPHIKTPNLDRLAREGVLFENACCATPVCTPSRCALHTGEYAHVRGPNLNVGIPESDPAKGIQSETPLFATYFHDNGYKTSHHGKWHLGDITRHSAWNWKPGLKNYFPAYQEYFQEKMKTFPVDAEPGDASFLGWPLYMTQACKHAYNNPGGLTKGHPQPTFLLIGRTALPVELDRTTFAANGTIEDIDSFKKEPFMMVCSVIPPHAEWLVQDPYYSAVDFDKIKLPENMTRPSYYNRSFACKLYDLLGEEGVREYLRCYYGQVMMVDDQVGRIIKKLEQIGQLDDTLIIFTSDHGDMNGAHRAVGKGFLSYYDDIVKIPLIMRWPKGIKGGRRVKTIVNNVDVMPTILDYAGLDIPSQCQGQSLRQFIDGNEDMDRAGFCERTHPTAQVAERMIRTHEWKLSFSYYVKAGRERRPLELFHLTDDSLEEKNLGADPAYENVRTELLKRLIEWMEKTNDPWLRRLPKLV